MRRKSCTLLAKKFKPPLHCPRATSDIIKNDVNFILESEDEVDISEAYKHLKKMSNDELEALLSSPDSFVIDCLLDLVPTLKALNSEHGILRKQVNDLANFNYAREPEFVHDRLTLRDTLNGVAMLRRCVTKHLQPILNKLDVAREKLSTTAISAEEESEQVAMKYLQEKDFLTHDAFIELHVKLRKEAHEKRILADKLTKEKDLLTNHIPEPLEFNSPIPTPRQRKRVSFNK